MRPYALLIVGCLVLALNGCSKSSKPTAPIAPPAAGHVVLVSSPQAATVLVNGAPVSRFTPCQLDTSAATYSIRLTLLGYTDTTLSVAIPANPESVKVTLRPLPGTPRTVTSWDVNAGAGNYTEALALDASQNVYVESGQYGTGVLQRFSSTGTLLGATTFSRTDNLISAMVRDASGSLYLAPYYGGYVTRLNSAGSVTGSFGNPVAFTGTVGGLAIDAATDSLFVPYNGSLMAILRASDGTVLRSFVVTSLHHGSSVCDGAFARSSGFLFFVHTVYASPDTILKFNASGSEVGAFGLPGGASSLCVAADGTLYVGVPPTDGQIGGHSPGEVLHLSASGSILGRWATDHVYPSAIAVASSGDIYASDFYGRIVHWTDH